jgi:hypothetical protein
MVNGLLHNLIMKMQKTGVFHEKISARKSKTGVKKKTKEKSNHF